MSEHEQQHSREDQPPSASHGDDLAELPEAGDPHPGETVSGSAENDGEAPDLFQRRERLTELALQYLQRFYPEKLAAVGLTAPITAAAVPVEGLQFRVAPLHFAAAVLAVDLPTSD